MLTPIIVLVFLTHIESVESLLLSACIVLKHALFCHIRSEAAKVVKPSARLKWKEFKDFLTDAQFRRMFRMPKACFDDLCSRIEDVVGEEKFLSEDYITNTLEDDSKNGGLFSAKMHKAQKFLNGGFVSGEVKLALTLRLLAGGSYLDICLIYRVGWSSAYDILHKVLENWICNDDIIRILNEDYLHDKKEMKKVAKGFEENGKHLGVITGLIGCLDGWLVRIRQPHEGDGIFDSAGFFNRKGFFAINVQVIVDRDKRVLWRSIKCRGAEHDSSAFKGTDFYKTCMAIADLLKSEGLYFFGDSAYALRSFLLTPYPGSVPYSTRDTFNYHLSSCRIFVECAFGEIDMRWGILWRPLRFSLEHSTNIIDGCMRIHNFIVDFRNAENTANTEAQDDHEDYAVFQREAEMYIRGGRDGEDRLVGVFTDDRIDAENEGRGRRSNEESLARASGEVVREELRNKMEEAGLRREGREDSETRAWFRDNFNRVQERM